MQTLDFSISIPNDSNMNLVWLKEKVIEYTKSLILLNQRKVVVKDSENKKLLAAIEFVDSLAVAGGENIPLNDDGCDALVEQKY